MVGAHARERKAADRASGADHSFNMRSTALAEDTRGQAGSAATAAGRKEEVYQRSADQRENWFSCAHRSVIGLLSRKRACSGESW